MNNFEFYKDTLKELVKSNEPIGPKLAELLKNESWPTWRDFITWLYEEHEILDKQEKEYLSAVIKPFKNKVNFIVKCAETYDDAKLNFIAIAFYHEPYIRLPFFDAGTMYKNMDDGQKYTLEELDL